LRCLTCRLEMCVCPWQFRVWQIAPWGPWAWRGNLTRGSGFGAPDYDRYGWTQKQVVERLERILADRRKAVRRRREAEEAIIRWQVKSEEGD